ncbi:MAG: lysine 2,3-aminomutase [Candidatus Dadabacteria bacterium]|nr:MAG: lysine 2,3-aminomutase [Candidatus Dadabacteria bacterium]
MSKEPKCGKYKAYTLGNFKEIEQLKKMPKEVIEAIEVVGNVLPFKTNNYVVNELINWEDEKDPLFVLNFPQRDMLKPHHYSEMEKVLKEGDRKKIKETANKIRMELNPHPAGQLEMNVPRLKSGQPLNGMQHKYDQTALFFASQGQTCHAYCTFCFRWAQFVGIDDLKFAMKEASSLNQYLKEHPEITDVLFTGGDPMIMRARIFKPYIEAVIDPELSHITNIRIGSKALAYWPYKFLTDPDYEETLDLFKAVLDSGRHLTIMAHFNHPNELKTEAVHEAIYILRQLGLEIRTQSPLLKHINALPEVWSVMWNKQVQLGCVPYYMFVARDTGAQHYFAVPLVKAWEIYRDAVQEVSGLGRTVRGPSMSAYPGKVEVLGVAEIKGEKVIVLRFLQGRNKKWTHTPFFAQYDEKAIWLDDLKPAFGEKKFFYEDELAEMKKRKLKLFQEAQQAAQA